jgi:hypothetical protein
MANEVINSYWNSDDCFLAFFSDVYKEPNLTVEREAEYHPDTDEVVIIDVFWDGDDNMKEAHSINPSTLKYYDENCEIQPKITDVEYDEIASKVKLLAKK